MPTTTPLSLDLNTGIVSPEPKTTRRRFFAMSNYITITNVAFEFTPHHTPKLVEVHNAFNNVYSEPFTRATVAALFTDTNRTAIDPDALTTIHTEIVDLIFAANTAADRATVAAIIDPLPLSASAGQPPRRSPL